jgi:hypothetical protein
MEPENKDAAEDKEQKAALDLFDELLSRVDKTTAEVDAITKRIEELLRTAG